MRNTIKAAVAGGALLAGTLSGGVAQARQGEEGVPKHGHVLVLGVQLENGEPVGFRKCVDIANSRALPVHVHHEGLHTGRAGDALRAAGHMPVPTAPLTPFANCAELIEWFEAGGG